MKLTAMHRHKLTAMHRRNTEKRITKKYPLPSDHSAINATRFDLLFKRRANSDTLKRNGLVCGFLPSVIRTGNLLKHLRTLIQKGNQGVATVFHTVKKRSKSGDLVMNYSTTRFMAELGTFNNPIEGCIPINKKLVALYLNYMFTKKRLLFLITILFKGT